MVINTIVTPYSINYISYNLNWSLCINYCTFLRNVIIGWCCFRNIGKYCRNRIGPGRGGEYRSEFLEQAKWGFSQTFSLNTNQSSLGSKNFGPCKPMFYGHFLAQNLPHTIVIICSIFCRWLKNQRKMLRFAENLTIFDVSNIII